MPSINIHRRIYFDDTDGAGLMYHTNYLKYMEHARSEYLLARGFGPAYLNNEFRVVFVITDLSTRFKAPARLGDLLEITAEVASSTAVTVTFKQQAWLLDEACHRSRELVAAEIKIACIDSQTHKVAKIPAVVEETLYSEC